MCDNDSGVETFFNSKITIRHLPPEITFDELKEELSEFLPFINHFHFIPGKSPTFYPSTGSDTSGSLNTKVRASRGIITFSSHSKKPAADDLLLEKETESPEEILNQKVALEEHYVSILGGRFSSAYINFTTPESILLFTQKFDGRIFESNRGRPYRAVVRLCTLPRFHYKELSEMVSSSHGSFDNSTEFKEWLEIRRPKNHRPQASLSFEQQTELMLEQERRLFPWKYDPDFFQNTSLMTFIQKKADLEKERTSEKLTRQKLDAKQTESLKGKTKIKKSSRAQTPVKLTAADNPSKPKIKPRRKSDAALQSQSHQATTAIPPLESPSKKIFSTNLEKAPPNDNEVPNELSKSHEISKKVKIFTTSKAK